MEWLILISLGAALGLAFSFILESFGIPQPLSVTLATIGALVGGLLTRVSGFTALGTMTPYFMGSAVAICVLAGGSLAYNLTGKQPDNPSH